MLIVSQNREEIINTENIIRVYIQENKVENVFEIGVDATDNTYYTLGNYSTKEKAMDELNHIARYYPYEGVYEMLWE